MRLTDTDINGFVDLWKKETGKTISRDQAQDYAQNLLGLVQIVIDPARTKEEPP